MTNPPRLIYLSVGHVSTRDDLIPFPPSVSVIQSTEVTEDKSAVEGVDQGEQEVRHHDEEHE